MTAVNNIQVSIIINALTTRGNLELIVTALSRQTYDSSSVEVIVVVNPSREDLTDWIAAHSRKSVYRLECVSSTGRYPGAARNAGAEHARGKILVFLDANVEPHPGWLEAHLNAQRANTVAFGYSKLTIAAHPTEWHLEERLRVEDSFREIGRFGHRFTYQDFNCTNFSISTQLFMSSGGFDARLTSREGHEYGYRLLNSGVDFAYVPKAVGFLHEAGSLATWLQQARVDGRSDVSLAAIHPGLRARTFLPIRRNRVDRALINYAFTRPGLGDVLTRAGLMLAAQLEKLKLRRRRKSVVNALGVFCYWRGVAESIGTAQDFSDWCDEPRDPSIIARDVPILEWTKLPNDEDLPVLLDLATHKGLRVQVTGLDAIILSPIPGAERLCLKHIESELLQASRERFIEPLALHMICSTGAASASFSLYSVTGGERHDAERTAESDLSPERTCQVESALPFDHEHR